ncbi:MAG: hypothetical protein AB1345_08985 [Chloroflexota bacterium]
MVASVWSMDWRGEYKGGVPGESMAEPVRLPYGLSMMTGGCPMEV